MERRGQWCGKAWAPNFGVAEVQNLMSAAFVWPPRCRHRLQRLCFLSYLPVGIWLFLLSLSFLFFSSVFFFHSLLRENAKKKRSFVFLSVTPRLLILLTHWPHLINYLACFEIHVFIQFFYSVTKTSPEISIHYICTKFCPICCPVDPSIAMLPSPICCPRMFPYSSIFLFPAKF